MKQILAALAMSVIFAACGGGGSGSSGGGIITPPTTKPTTYSVKISFSGGASLRSTAQAIMHPLERIVRSHPLDTGTGSAQLPVEISVQPPSNDLIGPAGTFGTATVQIQPQPSAQPNVSVSVSGVSVAVTPQPYTNPQPTDAPRFAVTSQTATTQSGSLTVDAAAPVSQTANVPVYLISRAVLMCSPTTVLGSEYSAAPYNNWGGITFSGGVAQQTTDINSADLYIEGSGCTVDGFTSASANIVAPHGMTLLSSVTNPYATLATADCSGAQTSVSIADFVSGLTDPTTPKDEICVNTQDGHPVKLAIYETSGDGSGQTFTVFNYEQEGSALDGF